MKELDYYIFNINPYEHSVMLEDWIGINIENRLFEELLWIVKL